MVKIIRSRMWLGLLGAGLWALSSYAGPMGTPFLINPEVVVSAQPTSQYDRRAASNGSNTWLVLWADTWNTEIQGIRLDAQGRSLDATPLPLAPQITGANATERRYPVAAWCHNAFWVVWQECPFGGLQQGYGRRIAADGSFLDSEPFSVENASAAAYYPNVCGGSTSVLTTWSMYSSGYRLWARTFTPEGQPSGTATQIISGLSSYTFPGISFGDFNSGQKSYLVTYSLGSRIWGKRIAESGVALDDAPLAICTNAGSRYSPWPAFGRGPGGTQGWWVVWTDTRKGNEDIYGAFMAQDGSVSHSSTGLPIIVEASDQTNPSLTWDGTRYVLGWRDYQSPASVRSSVMDENGVAADVLGSLVSTNEQYSPMVCALNEGRFLAVYGYESVFRAVLVASGSALSVGTQALVSVSGAQERYNSGVCDGTNYWAAFEYHPVHTERLGDIALQCLSPGGVPMFSSPVLVCTNSANQDQPSVALARDALLVVWEDERNPRYQIWGQRTTRNGQLIGTNLQIGVSTSQAYSPATASDGTNYVVVWEDTATSQARGRFVDPSGTMAAVFDVGGTDISDPSATFGGGCYLVLWGDNNGPTRYVSFRRYSPDGTALGVASNLHQSTWSCWTPVAAYNPHNNQYLVTWRDQETYQILGRALDASTAAQGNVFTTAVISAWTSSENCDVAYDGQDWVCLFRDTRGGLNSLYGVRVQSDGTVLDPSPFLILSGGRFGSLVPPVAPLTNTLILGTRQVYETSKCAYNTAKSMGVFWQPGAPVTPGQQIEGQSVRVSASGQMNFSFQQSAPASTNYVVEGCSALSEQVWQTVTNCFLLDSGVGVSATWNESNGAPTQRIYRARGL